MAVATYASGPSALAAQITEAWARHLERRQSTPSPHPYVYASAYRVCERRMVFEMTQPAAMPPFSAETLARFRRGEDRERDLLADLQKVGRDTEPQLQVIGQQERFELRDKKGRVAIAGKVDARLRIEGTLVKAPIEVKAWSPQVVASIQRFEDLFESPWTRSGAYQLLTYLFAAGEYFGFLLLDRAGLPLLLPVELEPHLDRVEDFLSRAERAIDHTHDGTLPSFYSEDPRECRRCPFYGAVCNPPLGASVAQVLADPELEAALERREQLKPAADEFRGLDTEIKDRLRGIESGILGPFQITGTWGKASRVQLPPALKKEYTVTDPKGRFTLEITRL